MEQVRFERSPEGGTECLMWMSWGSPLWEESHWKAGRWDSSVLLRECGRPVQLQQRELGWTRERRAGLCAASQIRNLRSSHPKRLSPLLGCHPTPSSLDHLTFWQPSSISSVFSVETSPGPASMPSATLWASQLHALPCVQFLLDCCRSHPQRKWVLFNSVSSLPSWKRFNF